MTTDRLSATIDAELLAEVRDRVGPRGVSAFVNQALRHELDRVALRAFLDELAAELGPPDEVLVAEAEASLDRLVTNHRSRGRRDSSA